MVYAAIGMWGRTSEADEYYVAGRRIPPLYNGMATAADWMSAASFISLAGALYLQGYRARRASRAAWPTCWAGPAASAWWRCWSRRYLRAMNLYTLPDLLPGALRRPLAAPARGGAAVLCSFTYVVAQIYGIGLIASRLTGVQFEIGILLGLGGVLLCSFLGGMRAITWTQVAQYVVLLLAFLIPVSWLAYKQLGNPLAPLVYGTQLDKIAEREKQLINDPAEQEVAGLYLERARALEQKLRDLERSHCERERAAAQERIRALRAQSADVGDIVAAHRALGALPSDAERGARDHGPRAMRDDYERAPRWPGCHPMRSRSPATPTARRRSRRNSTFAPQLPGADVLPDGGHGGPAAPADALLHDAQRGARRARRWPGRCCSSRCST